MNKSRLFCDGWEFSKNPIGTEYIDAKDWHSVDIPHDWLIYQTKNLYETSTGWYRKRFLAHKDRRTAVRFEGVYMDSKVYVNGVIAGEWKYGYSTFEFDITDLLKDGENEISVRVDYRCPNTRWYSGAGIFRDVYIKEYEPVHISPDGVYITAKGDGTAQITVECERPADMKVDGLSLCVSIEKDGAVLAEQKLPVCACDISRIPQPVRHEGMRYSRNSFIFRLDDVRKWDITDPVLYTARAVLFSGDEKVHEETVSFGFRDIRFDTDKGFFINDRHVKLHGCCEHHDNGALGAAFNRAAFRRKLEKLRTMGINAIRTSHNMPAVGVLELCDEMGFLVLCEAFDMWEMHKTEYDYAGFFKEWVDKDVASWIRRDRNHPCIFGWSVGNEIYDTHADEHGQEIISKLVGLVREHDPRENAHVTIGSNYMQWENAQKCADIVKLAGYNYTERLYEEHHKAHPDWFIYGSETASTLQSRGIYHFPLSQSVLADDDKQCSAIGNCSTGWGAKNTEACIIPDRDAEFCAGQFIWTGFDYIGEPTPYDTKNSYFGQYDTAGFPKDSVYIYRGAWTDYKTAPFVHIYPYWDHIEDTPVDVRVATNAPFVKLFFNGECVAEKNIDHAHGTELTLDTVINYKRGELTAVAYDESGTEIARDSVRSFKNAEKIVLKPESTALRADGRDLIYVDISAADEDGNPVANANDRIFVEVTGAGRLVGLDNGDSTDYEEYKGTSRRLFSGRLLAIIAATDRTGEICFRASSPSLTSAEVRLTAIAGDYPEGITSIEKNVPMPSDCPDESKDIPIRRIDFACGSRKFTEGHETMVIEPVIYPANASQSYIDEIEYRITTVLGIESNLATVEKDSGKLTVRCKGDGKFYLRALARNGTDQVHIISALPLTAEGVGNATFDPYHFVTGGLYNIQSGNAGNGIDKGAAFAHEDSWFGFENVDFGPVGSDTITIPIYANVTTPVKLEIYDSTPDGGELLGSFTYHLPPQWLTYQPATYKLNKKLKGMHTIVMRSADGYSVKGFEFERPEKEFAEINAADNESIYGDRFTAGKDEVTGIGNNVVLDFGEFDFTDRQPSKLCITGRSLLPVNSVHLIVDGEKTQRILCEFAKAEEYTERSFPVEGITGKCRISFGFLPGSDFDFKSFRFE